MSTFTIDSENTIVAHAVAPANLENAQTFESEKELAKLAGDWPGSRLADIWNSFAGDWPGSRLADIWNSFAGVAPFTDLKPVKKFTNRGVAAARIWAAIQRLSPDSAQQARDVAPAKEESKKSSAKPGKRARAKQGAKAAKGGSEERSNKKAEVLAMMKHAKGATLAEIMEATGWEAHTVRGFVSILGSKGGIEVESSKNAAGERTYRVAK